MHAHIQESPQRSLLPSPAWLGRETPTRAPSVHLKPRSPSAPELDVPTTARYGFDFSQVAIYPRDGSPETKVRRPTFGHDSTAMSPLATGKRLAAPTEEDIWEVIAGNGGPTTVPTTVPTPHAPPAPAAPAPAKAPVTPPKLTKKTVKGPSSRDCGAYRWVVQWELDQAASKGGWVVQKVDLLYDVKDCGGKAVDPAKVGGWQPSCCPYWEAWKINKGQKVTTYAEVGDVEDDTYGSPGTGTNTKGSTTLKGTAEFYDGLTLPSTFKVTNAAPTWILPATKSAPTLSGGTGAISHDLKATWDCCGADKTTKIATI